jgi:hypothetical protein
MANNRFNKQVTPKGYKMGGDVKKIEKTFGSKNKKKVAKKFKGFSKLPEKVQQKIDAKLAKKV